MAKADETTSDEAVSFPPLNFRAARRRLIAALVATIVAPLGIAALYGWYTYERAIADESARLGQLAWIAGSRMTGLLDVNQELIAQVEQAVAAGDSLGTTTESAALRKRLEALVSAHPQVAALSLLDTDGKLLTSSNSRSTLTDAIGNRDDLAVIRSKSSKLYVSLPEPGQVEHADVVNIFTARTGGDGRFQGAIVVSVKKDILWQFCRELITENPALTVGLYRDDGGILIRVPPPRLANPPDKHPYLEKQFARGAEHGIMKIDSPLDGKMKLLAYRRAGHYPVYASAGLQLSDLMYDWIRGDMSIVLAAFFPCICLWLLLGYSLRRLRAEEMSWLNWRRELSRRQTAEAATRKLQRMGALGNLVASVAHDFNNLLMVVAANMELARRKGYSDVKGEVDAVERASASARQLARRLMSVARRQPLQLQVIHPERWLLETQPLIRSALSSKVTLAMKVEKDVWPIKVDPSEMTSALINIAVNAKDAMPHGGTFTVSCNNVSFSRFRYGLDAGDYIEFSCEDSGTGMTSEVAQHAFEPLFTTKLAGAGTGLGLAQVSAMAEQAGGKARLETGVDKGTTIFMYVPRWEGSVAEAPKDEKAMPSLERNDGRPNVLLVEDNEEVAAGLMAVLEVLGCDAHHEASGDAALKILEKGQQFDLVLSDIQMPGACDGIGLVEWIKTHRPQQAVTLMTGYAEHFEQARRLGVAVLSKPFNVDDLSKLLKGGVLPDGQS